MEQLGSHRTDFREIFIFEYFLEIYRESSSFVKYLTKTTGTLNEDLFFLLYIAELILE